jgi:hypothetical protein
MTTSRAQGADDDPRAERGRADEAPDHPRETRLGVLRGSVGYTAADLTTFVAESDGDRFTADLLPTTLQGPSARLGAGLRLSAVSLSLVGSLAAFSADQRFEMDSLYLWSVDGELAFHLFSGARVEPYLLLGAGYTSLNGIEDAVPGVEGAYRVRGVNARGGIGLDYYATETFSIGALATAELLFLTRPGVSALGLMQPEQVETVGEARARALEGNGSSVGAAYSIVVGPGLHF